MGIVSTSLSQSNNMKFLLVLAARTMRVPLSPVLTVSSPTAWSLLSPLPLLLRLMLRLTPRLTPGCTITAWDMPLTPTAMVITDMVSDTLVIITVTLPIMDTLMLTMATTARGRLRLNLLPRLMPKLPPRLTPGCTITGWDMPLTHASSSSSSHHNALHCNTLHCNALERRGRRLLLNYSRIAISTTNICHGVPARTPH